MAYIPEDAEWYLAWVVVEHIVGGDSRNVVHTNLMLIRAHSPDEAYVKAIELGKASDMTYENPQGESVVSVFRGLRELCVIYDKLEDGGELTYDEKFGVPNEEIERGIKPKERLAVFSEEDVAAKPDYMPKEIADELERRFGEGEGSSGGAS
jgi:hypothetical protein